MQPPPPARTLRRHTLRNRTRERNKGVDTIKETRPDLPNKSRIQRPSRATWVADTSPEPEHCRSEIRGLPISVSRPRPINTLTTVCFCCHPERSEGSRNTPGRLYRSILSATKFLQSPAISEKSKFTPLRSKSQFFPTAGVHLRK